MRPLRIALLLIFCCIVTKRVAAQTAQLNALPVVLSGDLFKNSNLVPLTNNTYKAADVVGFIYVPGGGTPWQQVPIQLDERDTVNAGKIYNTKTYVDTAWSRGYGSANAPKAGYYSVFYSIQYCDTNTFMGADRHPEFDADDELAFMLRDLGAVKAPGTATPPEGVDTYSGVEVKVFNAVTGGYNYLYLFNRMPASGLIPSAHKAYVNNYVFSFTSAGKKYAAADFKKHYNLFTGPNIEASYVSTPYYHRGFADRWIDDTLKIDTGSGSHINLYDKHNFALRPGSCGRSTYTFSGEDTLNNPSFACNPDTMAVPQSEGTFIANIVGPVRAIRAYMGSNSGPLTERTHVFYDQLEVIYTNLRVHPINGLMDFYDYNQAAGNMLYNNNNNNPATQADFKKQSGNKGLVIDGTPDPLWKNGPLIWELINSGAGNIFRYDFLDTNIPPYTKGATQPTMYQQSYYLDDYNAQAESTTNGGVTCQCTGDGHAWGSSGAFLTPVPNDSNASQPDAFPYTDPRYTIPPNYHINSTQINVYMPSSSPQADTTVWIKAMKYETGKPDNTVTNWPLNYYSTNSKGYVNLYPNPTSGIITLNVVGNVGQPITAVFYTITGKKIYTTTGTGSLNQQVDLRAQSSGVYIVRVQIGSAVTSRKIILTK